MRPVTSSLHAKLRAGALGAASMWLSIFAWADAPAGRYTIDAGTVYDTSTLLTWQQAPTRDYLLWADANRYCTTLSLNGYGWRLPSVTELETLVDETCSSPAIDPSAFPNTDSDYYWTSSYVARFPTYAWTVGFQIGLANFFTVSDSLQLVRCVR